MKKIISFLLAAMLMVPQSVSTMQPAAPAVVAPSITAAQVADLLYTGIKGTAQIAWYLGSQTLYVASEIIGRAATDLGIKDAAVSTSVYGKEVLRWKMLPAAIVYTGCLIYADPQLLAFPKMRQDLSELAEMLEPKNPLKLQGQGNLICHWNMKDYPTASELAAIGNDANKIRTFLIQLAEGVINHRFKNISSEGLQGLSGLDLVRAAKDRLHAYIAVEKEVLSGVLHTLRGQHTLQDCENSLKQLLPEETIDGRLLLQENRPQGVINTKAQRKNFIVGAGLPLKKWFGLTLLLGLEGNTFAFDYANALKEACKKAGTELTLAPSELTPAQYKIVDEHMKEQASVWNNKIKFLRGHVHYAPAAQLYWDTYKKYHRLEVIDALLNTIDHNLPRQLNQKIVYHFNV